MVIALAGAAFSTTVPWRYREGGGQSLWSWQTSVFLAVIVRSADRWLWEVSVNDTVVLGSGVSVDFEEGEQFALETIGKAFPSHAGFSHLTDAAAAHYTFADGKRYDLAEFDSAAVIVTIDTGQRITGTLGIRDWWLHLTNGERTVDVHPAHVIRVESPYR